MKQKTFSLCQLKVKDMSGRAYMSYTVGRKHIRLSWFDPETYLV